MWLFLLTTASGAQIDLSTPTNTHKVVCNGAPMQLVSNNLLRCEVPTGSHRIEVRSVLGKTLAYTDVSVDSPEQRVVLGYSKRNLYPIETTTVEAPPVQVRYTPPAVEPAPSPSNTTVMSVEMRGPDGWITMNVQVPDDFDTADTTTTQRHLPMAEVDFDALSGRVLPSDGRVAILEAAATEHHFTVEQAIRLTPRSIPHSQRVAMFDLLVYRLTDPANVHLLVAHINQAHTTDGNTIRNDHVGKVASQSEHPVTAACRETFEPPRDSKCIKKAAQRAEGAREVRACARLDTPNLTRECFDRLTESRHAPAPILEACIETMGADVEAMRCYNVALDAKADPVQDIRACSVLPSPEERRRCVGRFNEISWEPSTLIKACAGLVPPGEVQACLRARARGHQAPDAFALESCRSAGNVESIIACVRSTP